MTTFGRILHDLLEQFGAHEVKRGDVLLTERFYKIDEWDPDRYDRLLSAYNDHVALVNDLALELTRAGNQVGAVARATACPEFRLMDPVLLVTRGPTEGFKLENLRPEYRAGDAPYSTVDEFRELRRARDFHVGS